jgi:hypothetical protein
LPGRYSTTWAPPLALLLPLNNAWHVVDAIQILMKGYRICNLQIWFKVFAYLLHDFVLKRIIT